MFKQLLAFDPHLFSFSMIQLLMRFDRGEVCTPDSETSSVNNISPPCPRARAPPQLCPSPRGQLAHTIRDTRRRGNTCGRAQICSGLESAYNVLISGEVSLVSMDAEREKPNDRCKDILGFSKYCWRIQGEANQQMHARYFRIESHEQSGRTLNIT